ncbi:MAG: sulfurtransferase [Candidatus Marinimicrobia bacterium]|jgi:thiosulfate/3-mercaptopyruvate sulfurtransferase|nr:sulfurtransferase [Candidatus Neomarinimicrobiota bacterium]MBT3631960.1 sulfurtransferase [Candidatus Neomarinimicrobiota bacterium]MBT3824546.1 sulfurtransferase [Candidatus Neomarinimicrobiota bacterium]MBT4130279.1 sulfurtransferase [Candidatus Neomarinimicrobiota bacterium]MBT4297030.1 sulfurtransferase [Candidatus Neomarinimicrobiota bacterium]
MANFPKLTSKELIKQHFTPTTKIIDLRPTAAHNGWPLRAEKRGGHIPQAISFPLRWFSELSQAKILLILQSKDIHSSTDIILTGYSEDETETAAHKLLSLGFNSLSIHEGGMLAYLEDEELPVRSLPRYKHLVHPEWLKRILSSNRSEKDIVLAHVSFDNWGDYNEGHIPGAIWLDTLALEDETTWNHRTNTELEEELCAHGINKDSMVILYGRTANPNMSQEQPGQQAGQLASMRAALLLMFAGVRDVYVLDGGLDAWIREGGSITRDETLPTKIESSRLIIPEHPEYITLIDKAKQYLSDPQSELVSVRSWEEFIGEVSGYHYIEKKGRIPGAVFGNCGSDAYHMENYRNHDDSMRSLCEIEAILFESELTPDKNLAFYCGTGWRASEAWFCTWLMGWEHVSIFDGGWFEWSNDPKNPFEIGTPE